MTFVDITKRKPAEESVLEANERLRLLVDGANDYAIYTMDANGRIDYWNSGAQALFGYTESEIIGQSAALLHTNEDRESNVLERELREAKESGRAADERWHVRKDGIRFYASGVLTALLDERAGASTLHGYAMIARDLTKRKTAEESIRFQANLLDTVEQSVIATDLDGIVIYWNQFAQKTYGWTAQDAIGRHVMELTTPEVMAEQALEIMSHLRQGNSWTGEFKVQRRDGTTFPAQIINSPINDDKGTLIGIVGVSLDITERKRVEQALRESENRYRLLMEQASDGIHTYDMQGTFIETNSKLCEMLGYTREELLRLNVKDLIPAEDLAVDPVRFEELRAGKTLLKERRLLRKDGAPLPVEISGRMIREGVLQAIIRDITERKQAESQLRESEERFRAMFEQANVGIVQASFDGILLKVNPGFCKIVGYSEEEASGMAIRDLTHPADYEKEKALTRQLMTREIPGYSIEKRYLRKDSRLVWGQMTATLVSQSSGKPFYVLAIVEDITERKQAEEALRISQAELQESNDELERRVALRTAALTETNDALQEEVRARLRIEAERSELLRRVILAQEDERRRIAREMHDQFGQGLSALTLKLAALKRESGEQVKLREQIEILEAVAKQLDADIDFLVWELRPTVLDDLGLPAALEAHVQNWSTHFGITVELHVSGLKQERLTSEVETVLYRITQEALNNTAKYAQAGKVDILLKNFEGQVSLIIEDDGVGFDAAQAFGSKDKGLGLIGMRERAALVGGTVEIESQPHEGTTVFVRIPASLDRQEGEEGE